MGSSIIVGQGGDEPPSNVRWCSLVAYLIWDQGVAGSNPVRTIIHMQKGAAMLETENVYCPVCKARANREKLLFKKAPGSSGTIYINCRGCKEVIKIELSKEPLSRLSDK